MTEHKKVFCSSWVLFLFYLFIFCRLFQRFPPGSVQVVQEDGSTITTFIARCQKQMDEAQKMKKTIHLLRFKARRSDFNKDFFITQRHDAKRQPALLRQGKSWERAIQSMRRHTKTENSYSLHSHGDHTTFDDVLPLSFPHEHSGLLHRHFIFTSPRLLRQFTLLLDKRNVASNSFSKMI